MAKRVLLASMKHEVCSFVPGTIELKDIKEYLGYFTGDEVLEHYEGSNTEIGGVMAVARDEGVELIPTIAVSIGAGPPVADSAYEHIHNQVTAAAEAHAGKIDGVMLVLHGAMATPAREDPEGELIAAVRRAVGPSIPIVVTLDMHCHFTARMATNADGFVGFHTHPHVDFFDTGVRGMRLLVGAMSGTVKPVVAFRKVRMVTSAETHNTNRGPMREIMEHILRLEQEPAILGAAVFAVQPWMDVSDLGWAIVVVADGNRTLAQETADSLAMMAWERRERFLVRKTPVEDVLRAVTAAEGRPYVVADSSDSVSGGAHGDGNCLLKALLDAGYSDTALLTITDPEAAEACFRAGVGAQLTLPVGGKLTPRFFEPVQVTGHVRLLSDGKFVGGYNKQPVRRGKTAVLDVGGVSLVLSERKAPTLDEEVFLSVGLNPRQAKLVQVKSPGGFRAVYEPFAAAIFELDAQGPTDSDLTRLPFTRVSRPLWPLDPHLSQPW